MFSQVGTTSSYGTFKGRIVAVESNIECKQDMFKALVIQDKNDKPWYPKIMMGTGVQGITILNDVANLVWNMARILMVSTWDYYGENGKMKRKIEYLYLTLGDNFLPGADRCFCQMGIECY